MSGFDGKLSPPGPDGPPPPPPATRPGGGYVPPNVGYAVPPAYYPNYGSVVPATHPLAIVSLVCGIASLPVAVCCMMLSPALSVTSLVCGIVALNKIRAEPDRYTGQPMAITGIVLSSIAILGALGMFAAGVGNALMDRLR